MTASTINSFPSLHSLTSPRGWALAIIALLHLVFFWALSNGLSHSITKLFEPLPPVHIPVIDNPTPPPPKPIDIKIKPTDIRVTYVEPKPVIDVFDTDRAPIVAPEPTPPNDFTDSGDVSPPQPVVVAPRIDERRGLSEPYYPPQIIRIGGEGTVLLSVYILADGRVGDVKLERSSGYQKLDESAMREAKKWRFIPGTNDGTPAAMWKQVPITFRLNNN